MQVHKRTEITVESDEVVVVRRTRIYRGWCVQCHREVDMVRIPDAQAIIRASGAGIEPSPGWHIRAGGDTELVCMQSLLGA